MNLRPQQQSQPSVLGRADQSSGGTVSRISRISSCWPALTGSCSLQDESQHDLAVMRSQEVSLSHSAPSGLSSIKHVHLTAEGKLRRLNRPRLHDASGIHDWNI